MTHGQHVEWWEFDDRPVLDVVVLRWAVEPTVIRDPDAPGGQKEIRDLRLWVEAPPPGYPGYVDIAANRVIDPWIEQSGERGTGRIHVRITAIGKKPKTRFQIEYPEGLPAQQPSAVPPVIF